MATKKRIKSRRSARKQKFVEVEGHKLAPELYQRYLRALEGREQTNRDHPSWVRTEYALGDTLADYRPSRKVGVRLRAMNDRMMALTLAVGHMGRYPFFSQGVTRASGCRLLRDMCGEYYRIAHGLREIAAGIEREEDTK